MPNPSHTPEQLARYAEQERVGYWIRRGKTLDVARELAAAPPGTCALCGDASLHSRARVCKTCSKTLNVGTTDEQMAEFRKHERYRYHIRRGVPHDEALQLAERAAHRGTCQICGGKAYSERAEICETHRKQADSERAERARKNNAGKKKKCVACGAEFVGKKGSYCPTHRYGHNAGKTYSRSTGQKPMTIHAGGPLRQKPVESTAPIIIGPPPPQPPPTIPAEVKVQKLPPVGLAARSFRDYAND